MGEGWWMMRWWNARPAVVVIKVERRKWNGKNSIVNWRISSSGFVRFLIGITLFIGKGRPSIRYDCIWHPPRPRVVVVEETQSKRYFMAIEIGYASQSQSFSQDFFLLFIIRTKHAGRVLGRCHRPSPQPVTVPICIQSTINLLSSSGVHRIYIWVAVVVVVVNNTLRRALKESLSITSCNWNGTPEEFNSF